MKIFIYSFFISLAFYIFLFNIPVVYTQERKEKGIKIEMEVLSNEFVSPVAFAASPDSTGRLFIVEQRGRVKIYKDGKVLEKPFLDISNRLSQVKESYSEKGLLGFAFHPEFLKNGKIYLNYSARAKSSEEDHITRIAEYSIDPENPDSVLYNEKIIMEIEQPESNHNGGDLVFGSDGNLYIATGDGGGAGDKHGEIGNSQDISNLLGKILRIDVKPSKDKLYSIPKDNPFINNPKARAEIFAYGLRNPWKISFDSKTGKLFAGDVGQNKYEEINIIQKGYNYGWRIKEGFHCYDPSENCEKPELTNPIFEYDHTVGNSVIGGYVFRKSVSSRFYGNYIFGDWSGKIFALSEKSDGIWASLELKSKILEGKTISSLGEDRSGEFYILGQEGVGSAKKGFLARLNLSK